jgi:hypothetical protein
MRRGKNVIRPFGPVMTTVGAALRGRPIGLKHGELYRFKTNR